MRPPATTVAASDLIAAFAAPAAESGPTATNADPTTTDDKPTATDPGPAAAGAGPTAPDVQLPEAAPRAAEPQSRAAESEPPAAVRSATAAVRSATAAVRSATAAVDDRTEILSTSPTSDSSAAALTALLTPRSQALGPRQAPIRDLADDGPRTVIIPKVTADPTASIRESLRRRAADPVLAAGALGEVPAPASPAPSGATTSVPAGPESTPSGLAAAAAGGLGGSGRPPTDRISPSHHSRRGWLYGGRIVAALLALLLVLVVGWEWQIKQRAEAGLAQNRVQALNTTDPNIVAPTAKPTAITSGAAPAAGGGAVAPAKVYPVENILLLGSDTRADGNGNATNSDGEETGANSDTLMIAHLSADRQHVTILSIPRDTMVPAPRCKVWDPATGKVSTADNSISPGQRYHINSAYAVGGPACTVTAVQALTGLKIDRVIGIDFNGFKAMVDALGGITVNVCRPIVDREINTVIPTAGVQLIQGEQALNLVRARNVIGDNQSDLARIRRQQVVLSSILRQVTSAGTLLNFNKLDNFLQAFTKNTFTQNITINDLVDLAGSLGDLSPGKVNFYTLPTVPSEITPDALEVDPEKAPLVFSDLINDLPLPGETSTSSAPKPTPSTGTSRPTTDNAPATSTAPIPQNLTITVPPSAVDLQIYNVTGQAGIAGQVQTSLNDLGFQISDNNLVRPESETQEAVTVEYSEGNWAAALTVAAAVPGSTLALTPGLGRTVRLMIGSRFDGNVTAVSVGAQAPESLRAPSDQGGSSISSVGTTESTGTTGSTSTAPLTTLQSTDLSSVNAGAELCA